MNEKYILRAAAPEDAAALSKLAYDTFFATFGHLYPQSDLEAFVPTSYTPQIWAEEIADPDCAIQIAVQRGAFVGYLRAGAHKLPYDPGARRAVELKNLYLIESAKGAGIADALMRWALDWAVQDRNADDLYLGVYCDNVRAQRFYKRYGFEKVGEYFFPVGDTRDREFMLRKRLR